MTHHPNRVALLLAVIVCSLAVPVAADAAPATGVLPGRRIDLKVLLAAPSASDAVFASWKAALQREGVPFDTYVEGTSPPLSDSTLADYGSDEAKYDAVILSYGDMLNPTEQAALSRFEETFGVRQISDNVASAAHGLTLVSSGEQGGQTGTLTADGKLAFPYLTGTVPIATPSFGYQAKPTDPSTFDTLVAGPNGSSYVGIHTRTDGTQELVDTVPGSPSETQNQLLRHGMISWVTRGVYLGTQRNYLALQVDDTFLGDDAWVPLSGPVTVAGRTCTPTVETTSPCSEDEIHLAPADVDAAVAWMKANGLRLDMVFNGGGDDPASVLREFQKHVTDFGWINHTWDHPNLDCSTAPFITKEITENTTWAHAHGLPSVASELVTGEHSGLANTLPGNPGTIDPPEFDDDPTLSASPGATLSGSYDYAITGTTSLGETIPSETTVAVTTGHAVHLAWPAVCHTVSYHVYRRTSAAGTTAAGAWSLLGTVNQPTTAFTDAGPVNVAFTDTGAAGTAASPPVLNGAAELPYAQNPNFLAGLDAAGIKNTATDASKAYPDPPTAAVPAATNYPAGTSFEDGDIRTIPRYPTNVYYNVDRQAQELDEYNYLYNSNRGCKPIAGITTCNTSDVTWQQLLDNETAVMFRHITGNDPRPHYFHESNLADSGASGGAPFYALMNQVLAQYHRYFTVPLTQLSPTQIGDELARQQAWSAAVAAGQVSAYVQDGQVHVSTTKSLDVPLTGTTVGDLAAGQRSGWTTVSGSAVFSPADPASTAAPSIHWQGSSLVADPGTWSATAPVTYAYQWQRCTAAGCTNIAGADGQTYTPAVTDQGAQLRVAVTAGNWISSLSQAVSAPVTVPTPGSGGPPPSTGTPGGGTGASPPAATVRLERLTIRPSRFRTSHGATIEWKATGSGTVTVTVTRLESGRRVGRACRVLTRADRHHARCTRTVKVGTLKLHVTAGSGRTAFHGRVAGRALHTGAYRLSADHRTAAFTIVAPTSRHAKKG